MSNMVGHESKHKRHGSKGRSYFPKDFFGEINQDTLQCNIPKFRKCRRQVKSVDAASNQVVKNSQEFGQKESVNQIKNIRKLSIHFESQYLAPNLFVMNPSTFLRRNCSNKVLKEASELKSTPINMLTKPLSLASSLKKFEIDDLQKIDSKLKISKNILNDQIAPLSTSAVKNEDLAKTIFFSKRNPFKLENIHPDIQHHSEKKIIATNRYIKLPKLENMKCLPVANLSKKFDQKSISTHRSPDFNIKLEKYCSNQNEEGFLSKCENGNFKPWMRYPFDSKKSVGPEEFHVTAYFGSK